MASLASLLPPPGLEVPCRCHAARAELRVAGGTTSLEFTGGITLRVEHAVRIGLGGMALWLTEFAATAHSPALGELALCAAEFDTTPFSLIELTAVAPLRFRQTLFFDFTLTIERPPVGGPPLVLTNKTTARLSDDRLAAFPPQGALHRLREPVGLVPVGEPDRIVAHLVEFPAMLVHRL